MSKTGIMVLTISFLVSVGFQIAYADETIQEKAEATSDTASRGAKIVGNRINETFCTDGDTVCAAAKLKHRVDETTRKVMDKTKAAVNVVD